MICESKHNWLCSREYSWKRNIGMLRVDGLGFKIQREERRVVLVQTSTNTGSICSGQLAVDCT